MQYERLDGNYYRNTEPLTGGGVTVPAGFRFNVSVPKKYQKYLDPNDPTYFDAACAHDYAIHVLKMNRWDAAWVWDYHLRGKVPLWKRVILFALLSTYLLYKRML
jgi:hypothetical protein